MPRLYQLGRTLSVCLFRSPFLSVHLWSANLSFEPPTRKWVVEEPSPNWSHHQLPVWLLGWNSSSEKWRDLLKSELPSSRRTLSQTLKQRSADSETNASALGSTMMEEIDRFQVPNAAQEAEMQPLVRHPWDKQLSALFSLFTHHCFHFKFDSLDSLVIVLPSGINLSPNPPSGAIWADKEHLEVFHFSYSQTSGWYVGRVVCCTSSVRSAA